MALGAETLRGPFISAPATAVTRDALSRHHRACARGAMTALRRPLARVTDLVGRPRPLPVADPLPWPPRTGEAGATIPGV